MKNIEAGVVFGDINTNPLRYPFSLLRLLTIPIALISLFEIYEILKTRKKMIVNELISHLILILTPVSYILFFSLTPRMTERWMTPVIPIFLVYASEGLKKIFCHLKNYKSLKIIFTLIIFSTNLIYTISFMKQLNMGKPRVNAYKWVKEYINKYKNNEYRILMYTNKGDRDPFSKIDSCDLHKFNVYESKGAQNFYPKDPSNYDMVILYSYMEKNYQNKYIKNKYPEYFQAWDNFTSSVKDPSKFRLLNSFETTKMDLIGIPEIYVYEKIK